MRSPRPETTRGTLNVTLAAHRLIMQERRGDEPIWQTVDRMLDELLRLRAAAAAASAPRASTSRAGRLAAALINQILRNVVQASAMLYALHDAATAAMFPARMWAQAAASTALRIPAGPDYLTWPSRAAVAWAEVTDDVLRPRGKPAWNIKAAPRRGGGRAGAGRARPAVRSPAALHRPRA